MTKILLFCLCAASVTAQTVFQKKLLELQSAEGLALMPDGGYLLAGLKNNCIQLLRFDADGLVRWSRQVCPSNPGADITISAVQVEADPVQPGAFSLLFRKGAFSSSPDNLLNLMKFDAAGNLLWDAPLKPEKRYGPLAPGNMLAIAPSGAAWASHAMGFSNGLPDFNQALVFKVGTDGQLLLRRFFLTAEQATANGIAVQNEHEIWVYGSLGTVVSDGFLLKLSETGNVTWAQRYAGIHFLRDGGFFPNGDLLLMATHDGAFSLTRVRPNGSIAWARQLTDTLSLFHCAVAADEGAWIAGYRPNGPSSFFKTTPDASALSWGKSYETCTKYRTTALVGTPDEGFVFAQNAQQGNQHSSFVKTSALDQSCAPMAVPLPGLSSFSSEVSPISFSWTDVPAPPVEHVFDVSEGSIALRDCCPSAYPDAQISLPDAVCAEAPFDLSAQGASCADAWEWTFSGAMPASAQGHTVRDVRVALPGELSMVLIETLGACQDTASAMLQVMPPIRADFFAFADTVLCPDLPWTVQPDVSGFDGWSWENGDMSAARTFEVPGEGMYHLEATQGNCAVSDSFRIRLGNCGPTRAYVPNAFSPNDDGENDAWEVFLQPGAILLDCQVFDRWGNLCFQCGKNQPPRWDGYTHGKPSPEGVYVWKLRLQNGLGQETFWSGDLLLIR